MPASRAVVRAAQIAVTSVVVVALLAGPAQAATGEQAGPPVAMLVGAGIALLFLAGVALALRRRNAREDAERARAARDGDAPGPH